MRLIAHGTVGFTTFKQSVRIESPMAREKRDWV